jgi:hypothetical protein
MSVHSKQIYAIKIAIETLKEKRREFAAGNFAYESQGIRTVEIKGDGITGTTLGFAESGHDGYVKYSEAIEELEDLIDILQDPGVTHEQPELFETRTR